MLLNPTGFISQSLVQVAYDGPAVSDNGITSCFNPTVNSIASGSSACAILSGGVAGGYSNCIIANAQSYSVIVGGYDVVNGQLNGVGVVFISGAHHRTFGNVSHSTLAGGSFNTIWGPTVTGNGGTNYASIDGGTGNQVGATGGTISGGGNGIITSNGINSSIFGGNLCLSHGNTSVSGGTSTNAIGNSSFAFGVGATAFSMASFSIGNTNQIGSGLIVTDGAISATSSTLTCATSTPFNSGMTTQATITAASWSGNVVTITANNSFVSGQSVLIAGMTPSGYNGIYTITSATSTQFTYALTTNPGTSSVFGTATTGCVVIIPGAGPSSPYNTVGNVACPGMALVAFITGYTSSSQVTLSVAASNTVSGATVRIIGASGDQTSTWGATSAAIGYHINIGTTANAQYSFGVGRGHSIQSTYCFAYGYNCQTSASYVFVGGYGAVGSRYGAFTRGSGNFSTAGDCQITYLTPWRILSVAAGTSLDLRNDGGGQTISLVNLSTIKFKADVICRYLTNGAGTGTTTCNAYKIEGIVTTDNTPTSTLQYSKIDTVLCNTTTLTLALSVTAGVLKITMHDTGLSGTAQWNILADYSQVEVGG